MKRRAIVLGVIALVIAGAVRLAITPSYIAGYRVLDDFNIAVQVTGGHPTWRAVTALSETATTVTLGISEASLHLGPEFDDEIGYVSVRLGSALGDRTVIDAASGAPIPQLRQ
jgi:hypothetical protein